jgi:hypothetical protein
MKRLACWIGRHKWELRTDHGDEFKVCAMCGKVPGDTATHEAVEEAFKASYQRDDYKKPGGGVGA